MKFIKNVLIGSLFVGFSAFSLADSASTYTNAADGTEQVYTQLCKAALTSEQAFIAKARELKVGKNERNRLVCNEMSVNDFAHNYEITEQNTIATVQ